MQTAFLLLKFCNVIYEDLLGFVVFYFWALMFRHQVPRKVGMVVTGTKRDVYILELYRNSLLQE